MGDSPLETTHARFHTTSWTLIDSLRDPDRRLQERAATQLFNLYWPAAYAYLRYSGRRDDEAAELTLGFFADVVVTRSLFERADPARGRLRTLVITALKRYVVDRHRRDTVRHGPFRISLDDLEQEELILAEQKEADPEEVYERRWATAVLEEATKRCGRYFMEIGKSAHWEAHRAAVLRPSINGCTPPPLEELAPALGFPTGMHVASALKVVRKRMQILLREVAAESAHDPDDQDAEYRRVVEILG